MHEAIEEKDRVRLPCRMNETCPAHKMGLACRYQGYSLTVEADTFDAAIALAGTLVPPGHSASGGWNQDAVDALKGKDE